VQQRLAAKYPQQLVVDAGGWAERTNPDRPVLRSQFLLQGLHELGLQVANVAGRDLALGPAALQALQDSASVQFISANIMANGKPYFRPYVILRRTMNGRTVGIGITAITMSAHGAFENWPDSLRAAFADPGESARRMLDVLEPQTDVQILLAYMPLAQMEKLASELPGYEIVVSGAGDLREAPKPGPAPIVLSPGTKCKFLGWAALRAGSARTLVVTAGGMDQLDARVADQAAMAKQVQAMKVRLGEPASAPTPAHSPRDAVERPGTAQPPPPESGVPAAH
jgi:2',3'-cyclic-nucleotide 2'-phosphodiesterase (5'-nucleotidase family)